MAQTAEKCAAKYGISRERAGPLCAAQPAAARTRRGRRAAGGRSRSRRDQDAQGRHDRRSRRSSAARDDARRAGRAADGVFKKDGVVTAGNASGIVDGGGGADPRVGAGGARRGPDAAGPPRVVGRGRRRADADGHGAGAGDAQGARAGRADARPSSTWSRSTRRSRGQYLAVREGARASIATVERQRRRDRARPSARAQAAPGCC